MAATPRPLAPTSRLAAVGAAAAGGRAPFSQVALSCLETPAPMEPPAKRARVDRAYPEMQALLRKLLADSGSDYGFHATLYESTAAALRLLERSDPVLRQKEPVLGSSHARIVRVETLTSDVLARVP